MDVTTIHPRDLVAKRANGTNVEFIDVRTPAEYREIHCEFARNVPLADLAPNAVVAAGGEVRKA